MRRSPDIGPVEPCQNLHVSQLHLCHQIVCFPVGTVAVFVLTSFGFKILKLTNLTQSRSNSESIGKPVNWIVNVLNRSSFCWSSLKCHNLWLLYFACYHISLFKLHTQCYPFLLCRTSIECQLSFPRLICSTFSRKCTCCAYFWTLSSKCIDAFVVMRKV